LNRGPPVPKDPLDKLPMVERNKPARRAFSTLDEPQPDGASEGVCGRVCVHVRGPASQHLVPERLNRVALDLGRREPFVMAWTDREALLERLEPMPGAARIVKAIRDVGATRPAPLRPVDRLALYGALELWRHGYEAGRSPRMTRRLEELRYLLARDLSG
jgi:hypothetical protein